MAPYGNPLTFWWLYVNKHYVIILTRKIKVEKSKGFGDY